MLISVVIVWSHCPCISLPPPQKKRGGRSTWETHDWPATPLHLPSHFVVFLSWSCCGGEGFLLFVHGSGSFDDVTVHLAMAPVAVMLNLRADALAAAYHGNSQRGRPTTGSRTAYCPSPTGAAAVQLTQPATAVISSLFCLLACNGRRCCQPLGNINYSTDSVPSHYRRDWCCHQTSRQGMSETPRYPRHPTSENHWPWDCHTSTASIELHFGQLHNFCQLRS